jgi:hypothetical protein
MPSHPDATLTSGFKARRWLWEVSGGACFYCGCATLLTEDHVPAQATVDHVIPRCCGGENSPTNRVLACLACNAAKGSAVLDLGTIRAAAADMVRRLQQRVWGEPDRVFTEAEMGCGPMELPDGAVDWLCEVRQRLWDTVDRREVIAVWSDIVSERTPWEGRSGLYVWEIAMGWYQVALRRPVSYHWGKIVDMVEIYWKKKVKDDQRVSEVIFWFKD